MTEDRIKELKDKSTEFTQSEQCKEMWPKKKKKESLRELGDTNKDATFVLEGEERVERKECLKK